MPQEELPPEVKGSVEAALSGKAGKKRKPATRSEAASKAVKARYAQTKNKNQNEARLKKAIEREKRAMPDTALGGSPKRRNLRPPTPKLVAAIGGKKGLSTRANKRQKALQMRLAGKTNLEVAKELKLQSSAEAWELILENLTEVATPLASEYRRIHDYRLEALLGVLWPKAMNGDRGAIQRVLNILDQQARLFALNLPQKTEMDINLRRDPTEVQGVILRLYQQMEAAAAAALGPRPLTVPAQSGIVDAEVVEDVEPEEAPEPEGKK